jgi:two-component system, chemotaxis family, sensor kinase CheA
VSADHPSGDDFLAGFMDDYFAECDEHLTSIRRALITADSAAGLSAPSLEELFRSFHSLKGLSGIVELKDAELLAHQLETYLGALRRHAAQPTPTGFAALMDGTRLLEQVIAARRDNQPAPAIDRVVTALDSTAADVPATVAGVAGTASATAPATRGAPRWLAVFTPTPDLAATGIGVDRVRALLRESGEIIQAAPRILTTPTSRRFAIKASPSRRKRSRSNNNPIRLRAADRRLPIRRRHRRSWRRRTTYGWTWRASTI